VIHALALHVEEFCSSGITSFRRLSKMAMVDRVANQRVVFAVVTGALIVGSLPFLNKTVREREANVAGMRDASYDAKDAARDSRLRVKRPASE